MRQLLLALSMVAALVAGCASVTPPPSPQVVCDGSQFQPPPSLTCGPAIAAALAVLAPGHPPIIRETFRWGDLCPPGALCAASTGYRGVVIFDFTSGPSVFVNVSAGADGVVAASSPAPYPSGY